MSGASTSYDDPFGNRRMVNFRGSAVLPMDLLVASPSQEPISKAFIVSKPEHERTQQNQRWAETRDQWIAVAAAAVHVAAFAYNLAFWGSEGMPSDRYWPLEPRVRLRLKPGRYGNVEGTKRVYYDHLARAEGLPLNAP